MKPYAIRAPFWLGAAMVALLYRYELAPIIALPASYVLGYVAHNIAVNILLWYKTQDDAIKAKFAYKDTAKW